MFAIIKTGGKQYKVSAGTILKVEKLPLGVRKDGLVVFDEVLLLADNQKTIIGQPIVPGATVTAEIMTDQRAKKISVIHFKNKIRYRKVYGHRQPFTQIKIKTLKSDS